MLLVSNSSRWSEEEGACYHSGDEGEAKEEERMLLHESTVAGGEGVAVGLGGVLAALESRHG